MDVRTQDLLFGTGRGAEGLRGVFAPRTEGAGGWRDLVGTYRGPGAEKGLDWAERRGILSAEQRVAGGAAAGVDELVDGVGATRGLAGAPAAAAGQAQYANPIYNGLMAQSLMREHGFAAPTAAPDGLVLGGGEVAQDVRLVTAAAPEAAPAAAATVDAPIATAADDVAARVAQLEDRMLGALQRLGGMSQEAKVPVLAQAVDATAAHGGDSYDVLANALLARPLEDAVPAFERALDDAAKVVAPIVDDAAHAAPAAAKVVAPVADDVVKVAAPVVEKVVASATPALAETVAEVVTKAVPKVVEAALPRVVEAAVPSVLAAAKPSLLVGGAEGAMRAGMTFSQGIDDTLRLLARF